MRYQVALSLDKPYGTLTVEVYRDDAGTLGFLAYTRLSPRARTRVPALLTESDIAEVKTRFKTLEWGSLEVCTCCLHSAEMRRDEGHGGPQ